MQFNLSVEQTAARDRVKRQFAGVPAYDASKPEASRQFWRDCAEAGIQALPERVEDGGSGAGIVAAVAALEELGYLCEQGGLPFALAAQMWSVTRPIAKFGTAAQRARHLPSLIGGGGIGANCVSEPDAGSDVLSIATKAERTARGYRLTGYKTFLTNAPLADVFLVFARTEPERSAMSLSAFLVERENAGIEIGSAMPKLGLEGALMGWVRLSDCNLPPDALLGREGQGFPIFRYALRLERGLIMAPQVGAMRRLLENTLARAKARKQFGQQIGSFQAVAHRLADMRTRLEAARHFLFRSAWRSDAGHQDDSGAAMTKLFVSDQLRANALQAMSIWGGLSFTEARHVQAALHDSLGAELYSGTSDILRTIIANGDGLLQ